MNLSKSEHSQFRNPQVLVTKILWGVVGGCAVISLLLYFVAGGDSPAWRLPLGLGLAISMATLFCHYVVVPNSGRFLDAMGRGEYLVCWTYTDEQWKQWEKASPRKSKDLSGRVAYITFDATYFEGIFDCWSLTFNHWLEKVSIENAPMPSVCITYRCIFGNTVGSTLRTVQIPIPDGCNEEAERVVEALAQKVLSTNRERTGQVSPA